MSGSFDDALASSADIRALQREIARLNDQRVLRIHGSVWRLLALNFARGLVFGLGTVLGASVLLSAVAWSLSQVDFIPVIGEWAIEIVRQIETAQ